MTSTAARRTTAGLTRAAATPSALAGTRARRRSTAPTSTSPNAYIIGREDDFPYVFVDMKEPPSGRQDDRHDDEFVVAAMRFHNLSLAGQDGVPRREGIWRIE